MWSDAIADRTQLDITNRTPKAFWNVVDWIRVNGNAEHVSTLAGVLLEVDIPFTSLPEPTLTTIPDVGDINAFIANIEAIRTQTFFPVEAGIVPLKMDYTGAQTPNYQAVNAWERNLEQLLNLLVSASGWYIYSGVAETGQMRFYQNRFRRRAFVQPAGSPVRRPRCAVAATGRSAMRVNRFRRYG